MKRGVFKIETVGDCYVAVTGVPEPRSDHAAAMCKFARELLHSLKIELKQLEPALGRETIDLGMRVGIHSDPVTAGVLRGEKARFQLFGDTMNTAARMESLGAENKIHVSEDTANLLRSGGKGIWVQPREDKVSPKGKGEMQTYWVNISSGASRSRRTSRGTRAIAALESTGDIEMSGRDFSNHDEEEKSSTDMEPEPPSISMSGVTN